MSIEAIRVSRIFDREWVNNALLAQAVDQRMLDLAASTRTLADLDFSDTVIGGAPCINPLPQFSRGADVRRRGLGRYYQEAIKDNYQIINVRLGVPTFNQLLLFVTNFYHSGAGQLARTGGSPSLMYTAGRIAGAVVSFMSWQIQAAKLIGSLASWLLEKGSTRFYTVKPSMPLYWNAVQTMANHFAVNVGIVPRVFGEKPSAMTGNNNEVNPEEIKKIIDNSPLMFHKSGTIDVLSMAQRYQRLARKRFLYMNRQIDNGLSMDKVVEALNTYRPDSSMTSGDHIGYLNKWFQANSSGAGNSLPTESGTGDSIEISTFESLVSDKDNLVDFLNAELDDGAAFVSFRVNPTTGITDNFTNTTGESQLASTMNNITSSGRNLMFTFAGGQIAPVVSDAIAGFGQFLTGGADSIGVGGIVAALTGGAFVNVPDMWKGSMTNLQGASYTIPLVSPYNHPMAQYLFMYIPLFMILAMGLPLSTGPQSYTSPFICEIYDKGRTQSRLAIVDSITVTRGVNTLAYNNQARAMGLEVNISFKYLDNLMHMPISMGQGLLLSAADVIGGGIAGVLNVAGQGIFDSDSQWTDYMASLSSLGLADQIYHSRKLKLNLTRTLTQWDSWTSPTRLISFTADTMLGRAASMFYAGTVRE